MRRVKLTKAMTLAVFFCLCVSPLLAEGLTWRLGFLKAAKGSTEPIPFSRPIPLSDGDQFQIVIFPQTDAYLLVLYEDTEGTVLPFLQGKVAAGDKIVLPKTGDFYVVSPPGGTERIHVVMAEAAPAALVAKIQAVSGTKGSRAVLDELMRLKASLSSVAEAPEKPVPMGGVARGAAVPTGKIVEYSGAGTYVKTISFTH